MKTFKVLLKLYHKATTFFMVKLTSQYAQHLYSKLVAPLLLYNCQYTKHHKLQYKK